MYEIYIMFKLHSLKISTFVKLVGLPIHFMIYKHEEY
jgi:hypothetical protein